MGPLLIPFRQNEETTKTCLQSLFQQTDNGISAYDCKFTCILILLCCPEDIHSNSNLLHVPKLCARIKTKDIYLFISFGSPK